MTTRCPALPRLPSVSLLVMLACSPSPAEPGEGGNSSAQTGGTFGGTSGGASASGGGLSGGPSGGASSSGAGATGGAPTGGGPSGGTAGGMATGGTAAGGVDAAGSTGTGGTTMEENLKTFVYVGSGAWSDTEPGLVTVYELDRVTLSLSYVSEHPAGLLASFLAIDEKRRRLFVADEAGGEVLSYSIDAETGMLTALGATASRNNPVYLWATRAGDYLLAANYNQGSVDVYPIGSDGKAQLATVTESTGSQTHCVVMDEDARILVANKESNTLSHFTFSAGALSASTPATTDLASPRHIFYGPGPRAYVVSEEVDLITAFDIEADGALTQAWQVPRLPVGGVPATDTGADIQVTPSGKFLYATNRGASNTVVVYDLQGAAPLLIEHQATQGTTPRNLAVDPLEDFVIVANHGAEKSLATFAISADGSLELSQALPMTISPYFVGVARF